MRVLTLILVSMVWSCAALAVPPEPARVAAEEHSLTDAVFVRPLYGVYRHCGGACLKSGTLAWYCLRQQTCYLSCATAPPLMKCAAP